METNINVKEEEILKSENLLDPIKDLVCSKSFKKKGTFTFKLPNPSEKVEIGRKISSYFGTALDSIPQNELVLARVVITLDVILTEWPEWWPGATKTYDNDFLLELYNWYLEEELNLKEKLKKNKLGAIRKES